MDACIARASAGSAAEAGAAGGVRTLIPSTLNSARAVWAEGAAEEARRAAGGYPKRDRVNPEDVREDERWPLLTFPRTNPDPSRRLDDTWTRCARRARARLSRARTPARRRDAIRVTGRRARARDGIADSDGSSDELLDLEEALYAVRVEGSWTPEPSGTSARRAAEARGRSVRERASRRSRSSGVLRRRRRRGILRGFPRPGGAGLSSSRIITTASHLGHPPVRARQRVGAGGGRKGARRRTRFRSCEPERRPRGRASLCFRAVCLHPR